MPKQPSKPVDDDHSDAAVDSPAAPSSTDLEQPGLRPDAAGTNPPRPKEYGGRDGPDPVRYGDWEKNGRCIDF